jgi:hypothetical protein
MAETIRSVRSCHADGRDQRPDVQEAIQTRIAMVLGGGYPERERRLAEKIRAEVLQAWCRRCNLADAQSRFVPVQPGSPQEVMLAEIRLRCTAPTPLRLCDDETRWPKIWRNLNRQALEALEEEEADGDEDLPVFSAGPSRGPRFKARRSPGERLRIDH